MLQKVGPDPSTGRSALEPYIAAPTRPSRGHTSLSALLASGRLRSVYQPIIDLATLQPAAYEALVRGPAGGPLESPAALFRDAQRDGLVSALDLAAQASALRGALRARLPSDVALFINVEPSLLLSRAPSGPVALGQDADHLRIVIEFTERKVAARPAELLWAAGWIRDQGWAIALDDVGAEAASLALMPFLRPEIIKLDLNLIQHEPDSAAIRTISAVLAQAEATGAHIVAEGIETQEHLDRALALGATHGQGWLFGRPGPLPGVFEPIDRPLDPRPRARTVSDGTPAELVFKTRAPRRAAKRHLLAVSRHLESWAMEGHEPAVVLATFQEASRFTPATRHRYASLACRSTLVAALGAGMPRTPAPGVRGQGFDADDRLRGEWDVIVVGPHMAGALIARDVGDDGPDEQRRFDLVVTYDRELVLTAAQALMARIAPETPVLR